MNPAQKPGLADAIWSTLSPDAKTGPTTQVHYVLDGGALLHRVPWPRGNGTYRDVLAAYTSYVSRKYGRPTVVFDGYDDISTTPPRSDAPLAKSLRRSVLRRICKSLRRERNSYRTPRTSSVLSTCSVMLFVGLIVR